MCHRQCAEHALLAPLLDGVEHPHVRFPVATGAVAHRQRRELPFGGQRRTSGSGSSTSPAFSWKRFTVASPKNRSATTAGNTCSLPVAERARTDLSIRVPRAPIEHEEAPGESLGMPAWSSPSSSGHRRPRVRREPRSSSDAPPACSCRRASSRCRSRRTWTRCRGALEEAVASNLMTRIDRRAGPDETRRRAENLWRRVSFAWTGLLPRHTIGEPLDGGRSRDQGGSWRCTTRIWCSRAGE
jgi:hypothetical protein